MIVTKKHIGTDEELSLALDEAFEHWKNKNRDRVYRPYEGGKQSIISYFKKHFTISDC